MNHYSEAFQQQGYVLVLEVFSLNQVALLCERPQRALMASSKFVRQRDGSVYGGSVYAVRNALSLLPGLIEL